MSFIPVRLLEQDDRRLGGRNDTGIHGLAILPTNHSTIEYTALPLGRLPARFFKQQPPSQALVESPTAGQFLFSADHYARRLSKKKKPGWR